MFNKLRNKLTLTNVIVVSIIFILFIMSIYIVMNQIVINQTDQLANIMLTSTGIVSEGDSNTFKYEHNYRYFYVRVDEQGNIVSNTAQEIVKQSPDFSPFIEKAFFSSKKKGDLKLAEVNFAYYKVNVDESSDQLIMFINTYAEHELLDDLLQTLIVIVLIGLVILFFASLYMANRSLIPIQDSWNRQKAFVADASHELRTPLTVIETTIDLLRGRKNLTIESQMKWIDNIQIENEKMVKLVSDLLLLARADSEQSDLEMSCFPLHTALLETYISFEAIAAKHNIHLSDFSGDPVEFYGDVTRLKQLLVILLDNAVKYAHDNGEIALTMQVLPASIEICVSDDGIGIPEAYQEKIFERFFRIDASRSREDGNVGLGLSIANWIVKEHNGAIEVESELNKGTTFKVILPRQN